MIKKVAAAAAVTNLFCFGALFWWKMAVAIKILLFDEVVGPSWLELENNPLGYDLYALWMGELCCDIVFFSFKKCKSETPLRWYQVKSLKYGDGIQALNQCLDPLGLCQCLLLHCNLFYSCRPAMGMSRSRYGVQSWGGHVWQKR